MGVGSGRLNHSLYDLLQVGLFGLTVLSVDERQEVVHDSVELVSLLLEDRAELLTRLLVHALAAEHLGRAPRNGGKGRLF